MKLYTDLSPLSVIRDRAFNVENFLNRLQWLIEEMTKEKSEFDLPIFKNISNLLPFGLNTQEIDVDKQVGELRNRKKFNTKMITHILKKTQICMVLDADKRWNNKQYR